MECAGTQSDVVVTQTRNANLWVLHAHDALAEAGASIPRDVRR